MQGGFKKDKILGVDFAELKDFFFCNVRIRENIIKAVEGRASIASVLGVC